MDPEQVADDLEKIARENISVRLKRSKVVVIANAIAEALAPYVACKPGCSQCCHMNTMIYEHEALRLAEASGRKMKRLPYRPINVVFQAGDKFNGKPCPFLKDNHCSVYEVRPLVCRLHHSLNDDASDCKMTVSAAEQRRPPMYEPDIVELPYMRMNAAQQALEPWGNIAEFFPAELAE